MENPEKSKSSRLWLKLFMGLVLLLLLALVVVLVQAPAMIEKQLKQYGVEQASVDEIHLNLLMGSATVSGVEMRSEGQPPLQVGELSLQWQWLPLFSKQLVITHLRLDGANITLREDVAGWMVTPLVMPPKDEKVEAEAETIEPSPWGVALGGVSVRDFILNMPLQGTQNSFHIEQLDLGAIDSQQQSQFADLRLQVKHPHANLSFSGELTPLAQPLQLNGTLELAGVDFKGLSSLLGDDATLSLVGAGKATLGLEVVAGAGEVKASMDGDIKLERFSYGTEAMTINAAEAEWQGVVDLQIPPEEDNALLTQGGTLALKQGELIMPASGWVITNANLNSAAKLQLFRNKEQGTDTAVELFELYDSELTWADNKVTPPYVAQLKQLQLHLESFDMRDVEQLSLLSLRSQLDEYGSLKIDGQIAPLKSNPEMHFTGAVNGINLPPLSSYSGQQLGYNLKQGQMDGDFVLDLVDEVLNANIKLKLRRLELTTKDPEQIKSLTEQLAMPLDKALDVLRDSDNVISLEIKLAGKLDELQVDSSQVMNKALGNSMKYAVISYAKYAIQPFGMLATASEVLGMLVAVRFEPLLFEAGVSELSEQHLNYLEKVSEMLNKKPQMALSLCGVTALNEVEALGVGPLPAEAEESSLDPVAREALRALSTSRGELVKRYLVEHKGVDQGRLFVCHPTLDDKTDAKGRVEVLL